MPTNTRGLKRVDDRRVLSGIVHVIKSGCRWVDCPADYGPRKTIYNRFVRWARRGIWEDIFAALAGAGGEPDQLMIDSIIVKAHRCSGGTKGARGKICDANHRSRRKGHLSPGRDRGKAEQSVRFSSDEMAFGVEVVVDGGMDGKEIVGAVTLIGFRVEWR